LSFTLAQVIGYWSNHRRDGQDWKLEKQGTEADDLTALHKAVKDGVPALTRGRKAVSAAVGEGQWRRVGGLPKSTREADHLRPSPSALPDVRA
jgi:hypothetical protein